MDKYKIIRYNFLGFLLYTIVLTMLIMDSDSNNHWLILCYLQIAGNFMAALVFMFHKKHQPKAKYYFLSALMVLLLVPVVCAGFMKFAKHGLIH